MTEYARTPKRHLKSWMIIRVTLLSWIVSWGAFGAAHAQSEKIVVFTSDISAPPYVMTDGVTFLSGIIKDLNDEAAKRANVTIDYRIFARGSVDAYLESGDGHVACNMQPAWTGIADKLTWTEPMFADEDIYWRLAETPPLRAVEDLIGRSFATYSGYTHADAVMAQVAAGQTKRVDLYASQTIFDALTRKRADYVIFSRIRGEYMAKSAQYAGAIVPAGLIDSSYRNFCAISPKTPIPPARYKAALDSVLQDGTLDTILQKYR